MRTLREEIMTCAAGPVRTLEANQGCELTFRFGNDFTGFRGHFPGHPILPAFVQLLTAECAVRLHGNRPWSLRRVERSKFLRPIGPNELVTVCWQEQPGDDHLRCSFTLRVGEEKAAVFTLELVAEEGPHA
jgi:3-hydroxyacyl-[acyl-carrier-protein] dehydratase